MREETLQKTQQIELLHGQNQVLHLQQRVDKQAGQNTQLLVVLLTFLVAAIAYWAYKVKRVQVSLRRFAETDALTGISNRHHFTQQVGQALAQSARAGEPCALIMFDLDHFKGINDSYGHVTGDWVLQAGGRRPAAAIAAGSTTSAASVARSSRSCCRAATSRPRRGWPRIAACA